MFVFNKGSLFWFDGKPKKTLDGSKPTTRDTVERFRSKHIHVLGRPSPSADLIPTENLCQDLKMNPSYWAWAILQLSNADRNPTKRLLAWIAKKGSENKSMPHFIDFLFRKLFIILQNIVVVYCTKSLMDKIIND